MTRNSTKQSSCMNKRSRSGREIFDDYPILTVDDTADDLFDSIRRYMVAIDSQVVPDDFPLKDVRRNDGRLRQSRYGDVQRDSCQG